MSAFTATILPIKKDFKIYLLWLFLFRVSEIEIEFPRGRQSFIAVRLCRWEIWFSHIKTANPPAP
jgi:hypothetical protein